ncbi:MAG: heat-inducible transcriptional repressor HrcA [Oscillospiraceae bacterium]|nr:heat-inducible transcriptional repressor HrcA [Oscillospiraceae bacterium]
MHNISKRQQEVLRAVIENYIHQGEPVGSKSLAHFGQFAVSPATIRSEMAELERAGYLESPHTSAGRIPTHSGYRLYVDTLMGERPLSREEVHRIREHTFRREQGYKNVLLALSGVTKYTSIAFIEQLPSSRILRISLMFIDLHNFMLVTLTGHKSARVRHIVPERGVSVATLSRFEQFLNEILVGRNSNDITSHDIFRLEAIMEENAHLVRSVVDCIVESCDTEEAKLQVEGLELLLEHAEYARSQRVRDMMRLLREQNKLASAIAAANGDITIYIGRENGDTALEDSSLVIKKVKIDQGRTAAIGAIGPCRMDYSKVVAALRLLADGLEGQ